MSEDEKPVRVLKGGSGLCQQCLGKKVKTTEDKYRNVSWYEVKCETCGFKETLVRIHRPEDDSVVSVTFLRDLLPKKETAIKSG